MIKTINELTLKDVLLLDETKRAYHLTKYWFVPMILLRSKLESLAKQIFDLLGDKEINELDLEYHRVLSINKLQILNALYNALLIEFNLKPKVNAIKKTIKKPTIKSKTIDEVLDKIKEHSGITILTYADIKDFEDFIQLKVNRFNQTFPKVEPIPESKKDKLSRIIYGIFNYMNEPANEDMRLMMFVEIKKIAEDRVRKSQKPDDNG